jgi:hypothetical protein
MILKRIIVCADRREFGKLSREQVDYADKITVGGTVVKNRPAAGVARA